jgi:putative metal-binding protein
MIRGALLSLLAAGCVTDVAPKECHSPDDCGAGFRCDLSRIPAGADGGGRCAVAETCSGTDNDGDDYCVEGGPTDSQSCCLMGGGDCDDTNAQVNPGATEIPGNLVDENCDGIASDQDGDGHNAPGDGSGGRDDDDCCDTDARAHPGQEEWFTAADGEVACEGGGWDYNCDGSRELEWGDTASCTCSSTCTGTDGWGVAVAVCGTTGTFAICGDLSCPTSCPGSTEERQQGCH